MALGKRKAGAAPESERKDKAPPRRKRRLKRNRHSSDDESCSGDEVNSEHIIESRLRTRGKLSRKDFFLLKLKRKRQGLSPPKSEEESESDEESETESERDSLFDGSDSDDSSKFIVEDDGSAVATLPQQFSMDAHENASLQFKKIFQFMVHIAVRPPCEREKFTQKMLNTEEYFSVPLNATRRRMSAVTESMVKSSRWQPSFTDILEKYPELDIRVLPAKAVTNICDVCRIKGRNGCKAGTLSGFPYSRMGYEEVDESEDEHKRSKKRKEKKQYNLGRFCADRVQVYHEITHWEYELFKCILREVDQLHEVAQASKIADDRDIFVPIKYPDGMEPPKNLHDADAINDWLVKRHVVEMEWEKIKKLTHRAQNLENTTKKGHD
ncbi:hypothetical protein GGX14DRAFT_389903 [Mycena pura]|uniref:DUF4211 domain-containing protein n=1 Tax=Mycena pura TaxID=153505 RepID=A0AAD6YKC9_9AGAR|nr:hypothetical protein GGX14DRAFT_389903 [Mycena pura]